MILTCPDCATRYLLNTSVLQPHGRTVRCARCGHTWHQSVPDAEMESAASNPENAPPPAAEPKPLAPNRHSVIDRGPADRGLLPGEKRNLPALLGRRELGTVFGWVGLGLFCTIVIGGLLLFPREITSAWPPATQLYEVLGLDAKRSVLHGGSAAKPNGEPLTLNDLTPSQRFINGTLTLVISGRIDNRSAATLTIPPLEVVLLDNHQRALKTWTFKANRKTLDHGQTIAFETRLENPPAAAQDIQVKFAPPTKRGN